MTSVGLNGWRFLSGLVLIALLTIFGSACSGNKPMASAGDLFGEEMAAAGPVAGDRERIVLLRPADPDDDGRASAIVEMNGTELGNLTYGSFLFFDVSAGSTTVAVSTRPAHRGRCELVFEAEPGATRFFEVGIRRASQIASLAGSAIGGAVAVAAGSNVFSSAGEAIKRGTAEVAVGSAAGELRHRYWRVPVSSAAARFRFSESIRKAPCYT